MLGEIHNDIEIEQTVEEQIERCKKCRHCDKTNVKHRIICRQGLFKYLFEYYNSCPNYSYNIFHFLFTKYGNIPKIIMEEQIDNQKEYEKRLHRRSFFYSETLF